MVSILGIVIVVWGIYFISGYLDPRETWVYQVLGRAALGRRACILVVGCSAQLGKNSKGILLLII